MKKITLTMIKPDAVKAGYTGAILNEILEAGFEISAMKLTQLTVDEAEKFYEIHKDKPFFKSLVDFMTSGPIIAAVLQKENAVADFRKLIGATNPAEAEEGTIRRKYAKSLNENAIHGSDSDENAQVETRFYFSSREIF